jgi:hypothetical protein
MTEDAVTDLTRGVYRRIYSGYITGQRINKLSLPAEAWFWRVQAKADDFGNARADPHLCKDETAGLRRSVTAKQISGWLREMANADLIQFYAVKGEPYLHIINFEAAQPAGKNGKRMKRYPGPDESEGIQVNPDSSSASDNNNNNNNNTEQDNHNQAQAPDSPPFAGDEFLTTLAAFEDHRKEIRKPLKTTGRRALYRNLADMGEHCAVVAMRASIANGWQGVFKPKNGNGNGTYTQNNGLRRTDATERNADRLRGNIELIQELRRGAR